MQDFIAVQPRREPLALVRMLVVTGLLAGLLSGGIVVIS
jgi:hypothetical protein